MREASLLQLAEAVHDKRYCAIVMRDPQLAEAGVRYRDAGGTQWLEWGSVQTALAAEVGEPEGVRTVVIDLVVDSTDTAHGCGFAVYRFDAEPGEDAMAIAIAIANSIGSAASASIKNLAAEGVSSSRYPDLEEFEAAALVALSRR